MDERDTVRRDGVVYVEKGTIVDVRAGRRLRGIRNGGREPEGRSSG
jgi:hypothetical protein